MAHLNLHVKNRTVLGNQVRKLRRDGKLPAVIYSNKLSSLSVELPLGDFNRVYRESGKNHVIDIKIEEGKTYPCIVHALDIHPVTGVVRHVDFLFVNLKEKVVASVPVVYIGESKAVKELGGVLNISVNELEVSALPDEIPAEIVVDISSIENYGDVIRLQDLVTLKTYEIQEDPEFLIASVTAPTAEVVEEAPVSSEVAVSADSKTEDNNN
jgi:large subunit ribosomal protein L25